jgi:hypothetical protein
MDFGLAIPELGSRKRAVVQQKSDGCLSPFSRTIVRGFTCPKGFGSGKQKPLVK